MKCVFFFQKVIILFFLCYFCIQIVTETVLFGINYEKIINR